VAPAAAGISGRDPTLWRALEDEYAFKAVDALDAVAKETGKTVPQGAQLVLRRPTVSTIVIGVRNEE
jgi:hypothetical protein